MVRRTKEDALATRSSLLDAAECLFLAKGVSGTSLNDIAVAAGTTRGAIYWHFKDKAELFNAMMERVKLPLEQDFRRVGDPQLADPLAHVRDCYLAALALVVTDPQVRRVFGIACQKVEYVGEMQAVRDRRLANRDAHLLQVERALRQAARRGLLAQPHIPARSAALGLHALVDGLIQNWMLEPGAFDLVKVGRQVLDAFLGRLAR